MPVQPKSLFFLALLVEKVVVDFDLGVGFEVVRQQHDRDRHLVEIIDLPKPCYKAEN